MTTLYLRPDGVGDETNIADVVPPGSTHYLCVDDVTPDEDSSYVYETLAAYKRDLYNLGYEAHTGTINWIKVWIRCRDIQGVGSCYAKTAMKTGGTVYDGDQIASTGSWTNYSTQYEQNPKTSSDWTWDDIADLQAGVSLKGSGFTHSACTQVFVEVDYTESVLVELTETVTFTDTVIRAGTKLLTETATFTDTVIRAGTKLLTETATFTDTLTRIRGRVLTETVTFTDTLVRGVTKILSETATFTALMTIKRWLTPTRTKDATRNQPATRNEPRTREE